ncbi:MAG: tRNA (guanine(10)-N(2))-dimethyltransferase [bacterium]|nr:tRNA (guanine(10)-N(2))-dimethyltransferase [bacterium]
MQEEGIELETGKNFYNPHMQFCRSFSSLLVGTLPEELSLLDGFSATGIRGIRYAKENPNIGSLEFVDMDPEAAKLSGQNAKTNGMGAGAHEEEFNSFLMDKRYDFLEIDPFGSPAPHIYHAVRSFRRTKGGYLSLTATDTAVLCGAHPHACKRIYHSFPLHDEIFHEVGIRILLKCVSRVANEFNFGIKPLASLSHRHFFKIFIKLEHNSEKALETFSSTGYLTFCHSCGHRQSGKMGLEICPKCGKRASVAGPLWLGELHDAETLEKMQELNSQREYKHKEKLHETLELMKGEVGLPPWFYEIHKTCARLNIQPPPKTETLLKNLQDAGFRAVKTHFSPIGIKTDADICSFGKALKG